jgi:hypothetical protein
MEIRKDKKYLGIYLTCVIIATILTVLVIVFLFFLAKQEAETWTIPVMCIVPIIAIVGDLFAYNSLIGYLKTPELILKIDDDSITFTPDKSKETITLNFSEIKGLQVVRPLICRSGKTIIINTENNKYKLEDVDDVDKAYELLVEKIKG